MKNSSRLPEERRGSALAKGCLFPHQGHFSGFSRGHQIRSSTGIMWGRIRSSLSHSSLSRGIFSYCHHIPRGWSDCYYHALHARRDNTPLNHRVLFCGYIGWVRSVPLSCGWVLQFPERVGIAYLVCFACLFPISCIPCLHFPIHFSRTKKICFPFYHYQAWTLLSPNI